MESEAHQNPLSKVETIEKLRTTIGKLEAIIEQLNSTSVVDLPASNSIEALASTTEELENAIAKLVLEAVTSESQPTPTSNEVVNEVTVESPEVTPMSPQEQPSATPVPETPEKIEPIAQKTVTKPATKSQRKPTKPKKKRNWIAIAIVALIVAIIPISLKYLSPGATQQVLSEKIEEKITETVPKEPSVIATKLPDQSLQINEEKPLIPEATEQVEDLTISEIPSQPIAELTIPISETPKQAIEETTEVTTPPLITEETTEVTAPPLITEETEQSLAAETESIAQLETQSTSESPLNIDEIVNQKLDETVALEIENIPEPEPKILVPANLVAEGTAKPLELKTLIHDVTLTPEQNLLAALSDKVLQLAEDYQEDIILSIEPNIANNILIVKISDDWYQLETTEQDEIVTDMFTRSQKLEFRKLAIKDQNDNLVARSPVVGQNMIIFRRDS